MNDEKQKIQIFGQRCSGTTFLEKLLSANFQNLEFVNTYGFKHIWNAKLSRNIDENDKIKIIIIVRDPYDWIRSVRREPHHCAQLLGMSLDEFIKAPWEAHRSSEWNNYKRSIRLSTIKPENWIESFPDVIECRNQKMALFSSLIDNKNVLILNYETLRDRTQDSLNKLEEFLETGRTVEFKPVTEYKNSEKQYKRKKYTRINAETLAYFNKRINWETESKLGYEMKEKVDGTYLDLFRIKFLVKQWYYENFSE